MVDNRSYGLNIGSSSWKPGMFVGWLLNGRDHQVTLIDREGGPDFAIIVDVNPRAGDAGLTGVEYIGQPEWLALLTRLRRVELQPFTLHDHVAESETPNRHHPLHLRVPMAAVLDGARNSEQRYQQWLDAARHGVALILEGGELTSLRDRILAERTFSPDEGKK